MASGRVERFEYHCMHNAFGLGKQCIGPGNGDCVVDVIRGTCVGDYLWVENLLFCECSVINVDLLIELNGVRWQRALEILLLVP